MRINQIEETVLFNNKLGEGKSSFLANDEIIRDKLYLRGLSKYKKEIDRLWIKLSKYEQTIKEQKIQIQNLTNQNKNKKLVEGLKNYNIKNSQNDKSVNTFHVWRVVRYLEANGKTGKDRLSKECCMINTITNSALNFLMKLNLVKESREGRITYYELIGGKK